MKGKNDTSQLLEILADEKSKAELLKAALENNPNHIYEGILNVLMRLVFILFAEDRALDRTKWLQGNADTKLTAVASEAVKKAESIDDLLVALEKRIARGEPEVISPLTFANFPIDRVHDFPIEKSRGSAYWPHISIVGRNCDFKHRHLRLPGRIASVGSASQDCVVCRTCSTLICGSLAHNPVETNQNHRLGRALNSVAVAEIHSSDLQSPGMRCRAMLVDC